MTYVLIGIIVLEGIAIFMILNGKKETIRPKVNNKVSKMARIIETVNPVEEVAEKIKNENE